MTSNHSLTSAGQLAGNDSATIDSEVPLLSQRYPDSSASPSYGPGELHLNKSIRKVNSGFQLLPAGTFNVPVDTGDHVGEARCLETEEKELPNKLQKKRRTSTTRARASSFIERI